jgi:hypothetical protein
MILKDTPKEVMLSNVMKTNSAKEPVIPDSAPDCLRCRHFKITWEPSFPRSCLLFGIKCRNLPSIEVFLSTGKHCFAHQAKELKSEE